MRSKNEYFFISMFFHFCYYMENIKYNKKKFHVESQVRKGEKYHFFTHINKKNIMLSFLGFLSVYKYKHTIINFLFYILFF